MVLGGIVGLVFDASALIDIADAEPALLTAIAREIAPVIVLTPILAEVETLSDSDCETLGLTVLEPSLAQLTEASIRRGRLSDEDHLCLVVARDLGATVVTSDGALFEACWASGVDVWRGLRPLIKLVELGRLDARAAIVTVRTIRAVNSYITVSVVRAFVVEIRTAARKARRAR